MGECGEDEFVIPTAKSGRDLHIPMSGAIRAALESAGTRLVGGLVFPGCRQAPAKDALPASGVALRRTYRTLAKELLVDDVIARILMGHSLKGLDQNYLMGAILAGGKSLREAQEKISDRIMALLAG
jgi:hypothetical protein